MSAGGMDTYQRVLLIGIGGLWYAGLVVLRHFIFPKAPTEHYLSKTFKLTAEYLTLRGKLVAEKENRTPLLKKLLSVQIDLTDTHETLRDILISHRTGSGKSNYEGKRILIFAQLVDMLELAMANPVNYAKTDEFFRDKPLQVRDFQNLLFSMADQLNHISENLSSPKRIGNQFILKKNLEKLEEKFAQIEHETSEDFNEDWLMLKNLYKYQKEQVNKIEKIEWLLKNPAQDVLDSLDRKGVKRFVTKQNYDIDILVENFNLKSSIFKHSLRLATMLVIGFAIGSYFSLQNPYWIALTLLVIMRPSYGLTKSRSKERTIGTLVGAALAVGIVLLTQNTTVYAILAIVSMIVAYSMIQKNYKAGATFITLSVVFVYALLRPDIFKVIQYRVMDTLIGASLATVANLWLWPAWEVHGFQKTLQETIKFFSLYLEQIVKYYNQKGQISQDYKLSRKKAFLAMSNLSAAFQRMTQEPKSRHSSLDKIYEITVLNHTFLASMASLSTYIMNHPTTPASENFNTVTKRILSNLETTKKQLNQDLQSNVQVNEVENIYNSTFGQNPMVIKNPQPETSTEILSRMEEAHLVREQLKWLLAMSKKMIKLTDNLDLK